MTTDFLDPTAAKVVLATERGDSIHRIAEKIGTSYSWTYEWVERLDDADVIAYDDNGVRVVDHGMRRQYEDAMAALYRRGEVTREDAYVIPHFAGMAFAYTEIDAAYVWTHGGYQVARSHDDYPVFLEVHDRDLGRWLAFFDRFGVDATVEERLPASDVDGDVHYVLFPTTDGVDAEWIDGNPVIPLADAIDRMTEDRPAYEPALEIIAGEYDVDLDASHHGPANADV